MASAPHLSAKAQKIIRALVLAQAIQSKPLATPKLIKRWSALYRTPAAKSETAR